MQLAPSIILKNQFGEQSNNSIIGGQIYCNFIVDKANGNGLGLRSLKSPGGAVANVFMNTSATPASGNPNPPAGVILAQLAIPYAGYVFGGAGIISPATGSPTAAPSANAVVYIASLSATTLTQWRASGLPTSITVPAVGMAFIANGVAVAGGGLVIGPGVSGISSIEGIGDPTQTIGVAGGGYIISQALAATSSSVTTLIPTAPADNSVISLSFIMANPVIEG